MVAGQNSVSMNFEFARSSDSLIVNLMKTATTKRAAKTETDLAWEWMDAQDAARTPEQKAYWAAVEADEISKSRPQ